MESQLRGTILTTKFQEESNKFTSSLSLGIAVVTGFALLRMVQKVRWGRCSKDYSMKGKTVVITGANSGIGKATALDLVQRDARVILACRNVSNAEKAVQDIRQYTLQGELVVKHLDLASFTSIRKFAKDFKDNNTTLDVLVNNAGVYGCPFSLTEDGYETHFAVNHLGHFLLTNLLLENLKQSSSGRIVIVSSSYYSNGSIDFDNLNSVANYSGRQAYSNSKLANMLFGVELHRRVVDAGIKVFLVSPGMVWTNLGRHLALPWWKKLLLVPIAALYLRTPSEGCQTVVHCAVSDEVEDKSGCYFRNCIDTPMNAELVNPNVAKKLWEVSETLTKLA